MSLRENNNPVQTENSSGSSFHPSSFILHPSGVRAWFFLVGLSLRRQARSRHMVWIALGLMALSVLLVAVNTAAGRWGMHHWRHPRRVGPTFPVLVDDLQVLSAAVHRSPGAHAIESAVFGSWRLVLSPDARTVDGRPLQASAFQVFSSGAIFSIFLTFLLPVWSLAFSTEALGGERESGTLVWLFTRPLSRSSIYLAKFVALLPWSLGLNLVGFGLMCLAAGSPGLLALRLYWPAIVLGSLTFSALFFLLGAVFRWPAVLGMVYSFCLEVVLANMPGYLKRISIGFYTRCLMFESAEQYGIHPENPYVYLPVSGMTAAAVLLGVTAALLVVGMVVFSQLQFRDQV